MRQEYYTNYYTYTSYISGFGDNAKTLEYACTAGGYKTVQWFYGTVGYKVSCKVSIHLPHNPAVPFLCYHPEEWKHMPCKLLHVNIYGSLIHHSHDLETPQISRKHLKFLSTSEYTKQIMVCSQDGILLSNRKSKLWIHATTYVNSKSINDPSPIYYFI